MTDALAEWFLRGHDRGDHPSEVLRSLYSAAQPDAAFAAWVADLRRCGALRNDDVTVMTVEMLVLPPE
jgi:hypothetical protein